MKSEFVPWPDLEAMSPCGAADFSSGNPQEESVSKSKQKAGWGMTQSGDSEEDLLNFGGKTRQAAKRETGNSSGGSGNTNPQGSSNAGSAEANKHVDATARRSPTGNPLEKIWAQAGTYFTPEATRRISSEGKGMIQRNVEFMADFVGEACHSCRPVNLNTDFFTEKNEEPVLGISRMGPPQDDVSVKRAAPPLESSEDKQSPAERRRYRHENRLRGITESASVRHEEIEVSPNHHVQVNLPPTHHVSSRDPLRAPFEELEVWSKQVAELERSISELTMRSSYGGGETLQKIPDNRRMAYYAVGRHHRQSGRGGNRRCYFSGKLILGGAPFYAGSVQQGLRTLVVFCLPSAIGLPGKDKLANKQRVGSSGGVLSAVTPSRASSRASRASSNTPFDQRSGILSRSRRGRGDASVASKSMSRLSSLDDLSLSIDGDLDPNWGLDRDWLLKVLPHPTATLLKQMETSYPEQFETLPVQVRGAECWKLYVKFCFFSGLPIAEGEMHYKVEDKLANEVYGEEIVLSHEVMEAVNGESAEILTLPNRKAFRYLRKHYTQQCSKLDDRVFKRESWVREAPEI